MWKAYFLNANIVNNDNDWFSLVGRPICILWKPANSNHFTWSIWNFFVQSAQAQFIDPYIFVHLRHDLWCAECKKKLIPTTCWIVVVVNGGVCTMPSGMIQIDTWCTKPQFLDLYVFVHSHNDLWCTKCKNSYPEYDGCYNVKCRSVNYALWYDALWKPYCGSYWIYSIPVDISSMNEFVLPRN